MINSAMSVQLTLYPQLVLELLVLPFFLDLCTPCALLTGGNPKVLCRVGLPQWRELGNGVRPWDYRRLRTMVCHHGHDKLRCVPIRRPAFDGHRQYWTPQHVDEVARDHRIRGGRHRYVAHTGTLFGRTAQIRGGLTPRQVGQNPERVWNISAGTKTRVSL